ncbi:MAG: sulfatase-like hydrolase/transferase, partial [Bacteroides sp.]|nr:sulfatase-like hydrolase/transferase [Bacteroides sp.]
MKQSLQSFVQITFSLLVVFTLATACSPTEATMPNIILIMPDDAGYGDYACLGSPIMRTPSIDAFMQEGLLLSQFHVSPKCS